MEPTLYSISKPAVRPQESLPITAEDGVALLDSALKLIATDRGATVILTDIGRYENTPDPTHLPGEVAAALRQIDFAKLSAFRIRLRGERQNYNCRAYLVEPRYRSNAPAMLTLHFRRIRSSKDAIRKLAAECNLTRREEEVLTGIARGLTSKELAEQLKISPNTVKAFLRVIMIKLGVCTRAAIVGKLLKSDDDDSR